MKRLTDSGWVDKELAKKEGKGQACNRYRLNKSVWGPLFPDKRKLTLKSEVTLNSKGTQDSCTQDTQESRGSTYYSIRNSKNQTFPIYKIDKCHKFSINEPEADSLVRVLDVLRALSGVLR